MPGESFSEAMLFPAFKDAAGEGAVLELKMRLLAGKIPALQKHAHKKVLGDIEAGLVKHFGAALSDEDKETLSSCRQLRNKILHSDFRAARGERRVAADEPKVWFTSTESFAKVLSANDRPLPILPSGAVCA